jgi:hypothetical protein
MEEAMERFLEMRLSQEQIDRLIDGLSEAKLLYLGIDPDDSKDGFDSDDGFDNEEHVLEVYMRFSEESSNINTVEILLNVDLEGDLIEESEDLIIDMLVGGSSLKLIA